MPTITLEYLKKIYIPASDQLTEEEAFVHSAEDYEQTAICSRHADFALRSPAAFRFVLAQIQYYKQYESPTQAFEYLIKKMRWLISELKDQQVQSDVTRNDIITQLINVYYEQIDALILSFLRNCPYFFDYVTFNFFDTLISIFAIHQEIEYENILASQIKPIDMLELILKKIMLQNNPRENANRKEALFQFIRSNFKMIYLNGDPHVNFDKLLMMFPEYKESLQLEKSSLESKMWNELMEGVTRGVRNREASEYPWAMLNKNTTISVFIGPIEKDIDNSIEIAERFASTAHIKYMAELLQNAMVRANFKKVDETKPVLEITYQDEITEYRFNINPENLDELFKLHARLYPYVGVAKSDNTLKLYKSFSLKEGFIRLCPVQPLDKDQWAIRGAGCQLCEMPAVQLLHLLPDYNGIEGYFHWIPDRVKEKLNLDRDHIEAIWLKIFEVNFSSHDAKHVCTDPNEIILSQLKPDSTEVKIIDLDENTSDFYILYGNTGNEELKYCKSLEISALAYFKYIRDILSQNGKDLSVIDEMIATENKRLASENISKHSPAHTSLFVKSAPDSTTTGQAATTAPSAPAAKSSDVYTK